MLYVNPAAAEALLPCAALSVNDTLCPTNALAGPLIDGVGCCLTTSAVLEAVALLPAALVIRIDTENVPIDVYVWSPSTSDMFPFPATIEPAVLADPSPHV